MNWNGDEDVSDCEDNEDSYQLIDPNDLYIIDDPNWKAPRNI